MVNDGDGKARWQTNMAAGWFRPTQSSVRQLPTATATSSKVSRSIEISQAGQITDNTSLQENIGENIKSEFEDQSTFFRIKEYEDLHLDIGQLLEKYLQKVHLKLYCWILRDSSFSLCYGVAQCGH